jgi:hypothetical protein
MYAIYISSVWDIDIIFNGKDELPNTIKSIQAGWQASFQSAATVVSVQTCINYILSLNQFELPCSIQSALLAAVESQLFVFVKGLQPKDLEPSSPSGQALLLFTYLTFLCSISATVSALILTDEVGELQMRASDAKSQSRLNTFDSAGLIAEDSLTILIHYGLHPWLKLFTLHCECILRRRQTLSSNLYLGGVTLVLGYIFLLAQILIYASVKESWLIRSFVFAVTSFILAPLLSFLVHPFISSISGAHGRVPSES